MFFVLLPNVSISDFRNELFDLVEEKKRQSQNEISLEVSVAT